MDFKERLAKISQRNLKVKHKRNHTWPMEKRIEVVSQYLVLGNMRIVAASTGVEYSLIRAWKGQPWWKDLENEIRATQNIEMDTKLSKIVDKSLDGVLDRVENGELIYNNKTGKIDRKPASLRDIHRVSVDMIDKRELIRGNAVDRRETTQISVQEQLKLLAQEFAKWTMKNQTLDLEMVEVVEDKNAVSEEWEEGLQEGTQMGEDHTSEKSGGESREEQSPA